VRPEYIGDISLKGRARQLHQERVSKTVARGLFFESTVVILSLGAMIEWDGIPMWRPGGFSDALGFSRIRRSHTGTI
jgi:hypothetical protein